MKNRCRQGKKKISITFSINCSSKWKSFPSSLARCTLRPLKFFHQWKLYFQLNQKLSSVENFFDYRLSCACLRSQKEINSITFFAVITGTSGRARRRATGNDAENLICSLERKARNGQTWSFIVRKLSGLKIATKELAVVASPRFSMTQPFSLCINVKSTLAIECL